MKKESIERFRKNCLLQIEKDIVGFKNRIRERNSFLQFHGRGLDLPDIDALGRMLLGYTASLKRLDFSNVTSSGLTKMLEELEKFCKPVFQTYRQLENLVTEASWEVAKTFKAEPVKAFSERTVKVYPSNDGEKGVRKLKMKTMKVFTKNAGWHELPIQGQEELDLTNKIQKENPHLSLFDCMIRASKEIKEQGRSFEDEKHFSESDDVTNFVQQNPGVPLEVLQKGKNVKRAHEFSISDGSRWMKTLKAGREYIEPVSHRFEKETKDFLEQQSSSPRMRVERKETKRGYSEDGKTFTDIYGTAFDVLGKQDGVEAEAAELRGFVEKFRHLLNVVPQSQLTEIVTRAIQILKESGQKPLMATDDEVRAALKAASASPDEFSQSLKYANAFQSVQKAVAVCL